MEKETDVNVAVDMVSLAYDNGYDEAVLLSADTDYKPAIQLAQRLGKIVVAGVVDKQKAGFMKSLCDDNLIIKKEDIDNVTRKENHK